MRDPNRGPDGVGRCARWQPEEEVRERKAELSKRLQSSALFRKEFGDGATTDLMGALEWQAEGQRVILISQGTVDNRDPQKLIGPALDALVDTGALLLVGTGHQNTEELRRGYPQTNVVIEDYVDFEAVLERADDFVCNGGFGSVMLSLSKGVPIVTSGIREGKGEVNARVEYFGVGINLRSEKPTSERIRRAADRLLGEPGWKDRAMALRDEMSRYRPHQLIDQYLESSGVGSG